MGGWAGLAVETERKLPLPDGPPCPYLHGGLYEELYGRRRRNKVGGRALAVEGAALRHRHLSAALLLRVLLLVLLLLRSLLRARLPRGVASSSCSKSELGCLARIGIPNSLSYADLRYIY